MTSAEGENSGFSLVAQVTPPVVRARLSALHPVPTVRLSGARVRIWGKRGPDAACYPQAPGEDAFLRVEPVFGFVPHHRLRAVDDGGGEFLAANAGSGQPFSAKAAKRADFRR